MVEGLWAHTKAFCEIKTESYTIIDVQMLYSFTGKYNSYEFEVFEDGGTKFIVKRFPVEAKKSWSNEKEAYLLLASMGYQDIPKLISYGNDNSYHYIVTEFIDNSCQLQNVTLSKDHYDLIEKLGASVKKLHELSKSKVNVYHKSVDDDRGFAPVDYWMYQLETLLSSGGNQVVKDYKSIEKIILKYGGEVAQYLSLPSLIHRDLEFRNILIDSKDNLRVIDWEVSMFGHPDSDLSRFIWFILREDQVLVETFLNGYNCIPERKERRNILFFRMIFCIEMLKYLLRLKNVDQASAQLKELIISSLNHSFNVLI